MVRQLAVTILAAIAVGGCAGDSPGTPPYYADAGVYYDQYTPQPLPPLDGSAPGDGQAGALSCAEVFECVGACADASCASGCLARGTTAAQQQMSALDACLQRTIAGACQAQCADPTTEECQRCVALGCKTEFDACFAAGGPDAFGTICDPAAPSCGAGLICLQLAGASEGFCTRPCVEQGGDCPGAPTGTEAGCILSSPDGSTLLCGFICALSGKEFPCPTGMVCDPEDKPPGSGQRICTP